jgi:hypothetical protein
MRCDAQTPPHLLVAKFNLGTIKKMIKRVAGVSFIEGGKIS